MINRISSRMMTELRMRRLNDRLNEFERDRSTPAARSRIARQATADTDLAEAIIDLRMQETAYRAVQGALARALQPSLAEFLR